MVAVVINVARGENGNQKSRQLGWLELERADSQPEARPIDGLPCNSGDNRQYQPDRKQDIRIVSQPLDRAGQSCARDQRQKSNPNEEPLAKHNRSQKWLAWTWNQRSQEQGHEADPR